MRCWPFTLSNIWRNSYRLSWGKIDGLPPITPPMFDTAFVLLVIAVLLAVIGLCQPLAAYLKLPPPVLLGVVGVALGGFPLLMTKLGWSGGADVFGDVFATLPVSSATFIYVFLPLLVFEAGIATDVRRVIEDAAPICCLRSSRPWSRPR
jgi:Na+:H+ antiporter